MAIAKAIYKTHGTEAGIVVLMRMALCLASVLGAVPYSGWAADAPFIGPGTFPQFRDMSGLPGGAFGVTIKGEPSILGAMAISTPIGFALGRWHGDVGLASLSSDSQFRLVNLKHHSNDFASDGTGQIMLGAKTPAGNLTGSFMILSSEYDSVLNAQLQLPLRSDRIGVSVGVQNLTNRGEAAGGGVPGDDALSRSVFLVGTYQVAEGAFVTLGKGDVRFKSVFGSACCSPAKRFKAMAEYDGYGWNEGIAYSLGHFAGLTGDYQFNETTLLLGFIQGRRAFASVNFSF